MDEHKPPPAPKNQGQDQALTAGNSNPVYGNLELVPDQHRTPTHDQGSPEPLATARGESVLAGGGGVGLEPVTGRDGGLVVGGSSSESAMGRGVRLAAGRGDGNVEPVAGPDLALVAGAGLLERAIDYALGSLRVVTPAALCRPTPCADWNLLRLLEHMNDSLHTLNEAATTTSHTPTSHTPRHKPPTQRSPRTRNPAQDRAHECNPALPLRDSAVEVLGRWTALLTGDARTPMDDRHLTRPMVAAVGAIEIAVHAWDVARACGERHPIPPLLAEELFDLALLFVTRDDRPVRFAAPAIVPADAPAQDHLLAYLGRRPDWFTHI